MSQIITSVTYSKSVFSRLYIRLQVTIVTILLLYTELKVKLSKFKFQNPLNCTQRAKVHQPPMCDALRKNSRGTEKERRHDLGELYSLRQL